MQSGHTRSRSEAKAGARKTAQQEANPPLGMCDFSLGLVALPEIKGKKKKRMCKFEVARFTSLKRLAGVRDDEHFLLYC